MRILGFCKDWDKLKQPEFTTFRFEHRGKPHVIGEQFQIKIKPRSKGGGIFKGIAKLRMKEPRAMAKYGDLTGCQLVTNDEALVDGFEDKWDKHAFKRAYFGMWEFLWDCYGWERLHKEPMNKMTLRWVKKCQGE